MLPIASFYILCFCIVMLVIGLAIKKDVKIKMLCLSSLGVLVMFSVIVYVRMTDNPSAIDIVLIYVLTGFVFTIAFLRCVALRGNWKQ